MIAIVKEYITRHKLLEKGDVVLIGVSGGPDSIALLHILHRLKAEYELELHVAHLNHMFRGEEAKKDAEFVRDFCKILQVPCTIGEKNVPQFIKKTGLSPQEAARVLRYQFLSRLGVKLQASKIALGQHADDQAETILLHLLRGSGLKGLTGMSPKRKWFIRPLLGVTREEIEQYIDQNNLKTRLDPSNLKTIYTRNRIRLELMPLLKENYNPNLVSNLNQMAEILRVENDYLAKITTEFFRSHVIKEPNRLSIPRSFLMKLPLAIRRRIMMAMYQVLAGKDSYISFKTVGMMESFIEQHEIHKKLGLPQEIVLEIKAGIIIISKPQPFAISKGFHYTLDVPGKIDLPNGYCLHAKVLVEPLSWLNYKRSYPNQAYLDLDLVKLPLIVRSRRSGDVFVPLGLGGKKKVKEFFIDQKIGLEKRGAIPVITDSTGQIIWLGGYRVDERYKITAATQRVLYLVLKQSDSNV